MVMFSPSPVAPGRSLGGEGQEEAERGKESGWLRHNTFQNRRTSSTAIETGAAVESIVRALTGKGKRKQAKKPRGATT